MKQLLPRIFLTGLLVLTFGYANAQTAYCTSGGPSSTADSQLGSLSISGDNATSLSYTGCNGSAGVIGLEDQTTQLLEVTAGSAYTGSVTWGTCGGNFGNAASIWIDYDGSGTFSNTEAVHTWSGTPTVTQSFSFTVPMGAVNGVVRMRVQQQEGGSNPLNSCASFTWGSVTDFSVKIVGGTGGQVCFPPNASSLPSFTSAAISFTSSTNITNIEYGPTGFTPGTGTYIPSIASSPYTITGLTPNVTYDAYVTDSCGSSLSQATLTTFTTFCSNVNNVAVTPSFATAVVNYASVSDLVNIEYGFSGFFPGTGTLVTNVTGTGGTYTLTGLAPNTTYDVVITEICGGSVLSSGLTTTFTTTCAPVAAPYTMSFEAGYTCWEDDANADFNWTQQSSGTGTPNTGPVAASNGFNFMFIEASPPASSGNEAALISPQVILTGVTSPVLRFDYHMYGADMGTLRVELDTASNGSWFTVWQLSGNQGNQWKTATVPLWDYGTSVRARIVGVVGSGMLGDAAIDYVRFEDYCLSNAFVNGNTYSTGWENNSDGWFGTNDWELGTPAGSVISSAANGSKAWVTNLDGNYSTAKTSYLYSPCFDLSTYNADPRVEFDIFWDLESEWDGAWLEASTDGGASWMKIGSAGSGNNWYNYNVTNQPLGDVWNGSGGSVQGSGGWLTASHILAGYDTESSVQFRFAVASSASNTNEGVGIDNFQIKEGCPASLNLATNTNDATSVAISDGSAIVQPNAGTPPFTFLWSNGDTTATAANLAGNTLYIVTVTDANGCSDTAQVTPGLTFNINTNFIASMTKLDVFPNPTSGTANVSVAFEQAVEVEVEIMNTLGQVIATDRRTNISEAVMPFDVSRFANGVYFVRVTVNNESVTRRLMVRK